MPCPGPCVHFGLLRPFEEVSSELRTQNLELRTQNSELRTQNSELRIQNSELRTQNSERTPSVFGSIFLKKIQNHQVRQFS